MFLYEGWAGLFSFRTINTVVMENLDGTQQQYQLAEVKVCAHLVFSV